MRRWLSHNLLVLYSLLAYSLIVTVSLVWLLPAKAVSQISVATASTQLPPSSIYGMLAVTIGMGFVIGYLALRAKKAGKLSLAKNMFISVSQIAFIFLLLTDCTYAAYTVTKVSMNLSASEELTAITLLISLVIMGAVLFLKPFLAFIKGERMGRRWFNAVGISVAVLSAVALGNQLAIISAFIFISVFSLYDFIAVFVTKHMQALIGFIIPSPSPQQGQNPKKQSKFIVPLFLYNGNLSFLDRLHCANCGAHSWKTQADIRTCKYCGRQLQKDASSSNGYKVLYEGTDRNTLMAESEAYKQMTKRSPKLHLLGLGDLLVPGVVVSAVTIHSSLLMGMAVAAGAFIGMIFNSWIVKRYKRAIPALPLICVMQIALYILALCI